jgi:signal transduction histidine kinase
MQPGLEVVLLGSSADTDDWAALLDRPGWTVTRAPSARPGPPPHVVIAIVSRAEAESTLRESAASFDAPLAVLISVPDHPLTQIFRALVEAKRDWEGAFDAVVDPVALLEADGSIRRANLVLAQELGVPIQDLVGQGIGALLGPAQGDDPLEASLRDGRARTAEVRYARLPGLRQVTTSPLQASRLADVGQLAAGVAHEINTPLASIALRAEALLRKAENPPLADLPGFEVFPRYLKTIEEETFRCKKIISSLLQFSRSQRPEVRETDLNALCQDASDLVGHQARIKQVRMELRLQPDLPRVRADDGQLRQALLALIMNALDAVQVGGRITLETTRRADEVLLTVADDGAGIAVEHLDKIFSPFFSTKPIGQGTGLGLAVSHGLVAAHGGRIEVSSAVGAGTRMCIVLPLGGLA